jgi:hypothetical protein
MVWPLAATITAAFALSACGGSSGSSAQATGSPTVPTRTTRTTGNRDVTVTCSPDSTVNACSDENQISILGGTAISILNAYEPETGSDISSETFTLTIQPGNNFKILGLKVASTANGGSVSVMNQNSAADYITHDPATDSITIHDVIDIVGVNISGGVVYKTGGSTG